MAITPLRLNDVPPVETYQTGDALLIIRNGAYTRLNELPQGLQGEPGPPGENGAPATFRREGGFLQWRLQGDEEWSNLVPLADIKGDSGQAIELQVTETHIQYRVVGDSEWIDLIERADLQGDQGPQGPQGIQGPQGPEGSSGSGGTPIRNGFDPSASPKTGNFLLAGAAEEVFLDSSMLDEEWDFSLVIDGDSSISFIDEDNEQFGILIAGSSSVTTDDTKTVTLSPESGKSIYAFFFKQAFDNQVNIVVVGDFQLTED